MKLITLLFFCCPLLLFGQNDNSGPGRALYFDGTSPSSINLGDTYNSLSFPFSISMWVRLSEDKNNIAAIFASEEGDFLYRGFWIRITKTNIGLGWGDGTGGNFQAYRRVKAAEVADISGKWVHLAFTAKADDEIDVYLNGILQNSSWTGTSSLSMEIGTSDKVSIGQMYTNGEYWRMKGYIDEMRLWNRIRTVEEIRRDMCRRIDDHDGGLIGYWRFDETSGQSAIDISGNEMNGERILMNEYPYSGAPIGDTSIYYYPATPNGNMKKDDFNVRVTNLSSNTLGYHIYVEETSDLENIKCDPGFYYGIFSFSNSDQNSELTMELSINTDSIQFRKNNFERTWTDATLNSNYEYNFAERIEFIPNGVSELNLGDNLVLCENESYVLTPSNLNDVALNWSDGSTGADYEINGESLIWASKEGICGIVSDTVLIDYTSNPSVGLERMRFNCNELPLELVLNTDSFTSVTWSNGIRGDTINITKPDTLSYIATNSCGSIQGEIIVTGLEPFDSPPNVFTPNDDQYNGQFTLSESLRGSELTVLNRWGKVVYYDPSYQNSWEGDGLSSGTYFYKLVNTCLNDPIMGYIQILR